jgi:sugar/nucleoside kinase (ribokinase family)
MSYDVVCAGVIYLDLTFAGLEGLPRPGEEHWARDLVLSPGGMANTAVGLARLGLRTAVVGAIGSDLAGGYLRTMLEAEGIACQGPATQRSAVTAVLPIDGDRALVSHLPDDVAHAEALSAQQARALVVLVNQVERCPRGARVYAITSHADVWAVGRGASFHLQGCHAVLANEAEALALTGQPNAEAAVQALSKGAQTAVVTLGPYGALGASGDTLIHVPAPDSEVRDTTGAGDLFVAAYVWADLAGMDLADRLRWSTLYASRSLCTVTAYAGAVTLVELSEAARRAGLTPPPL